MTVDQARRRSRRAALLQLAAHVLRRVPVRGGAALGRELETRAAAELVGDAFGRGALEAG